jgi:hypothetical protein
MQRNYVFPVLILCLELFAGTANAASDTGLFLEDWPLEMDLHLDLKELCRKEDPAQCQDVPATLTYVLEGQQSQDIPVQVKTRGSWRLKRETCTIPPLFLVFPQQQSKETLFAGQDLLPLTTHCSSKRGRNDDYVLKEYLAYRIYNLFSEKSVRVRLVFIRYRKSKDHKPPKPHYAFFSEHFNSVAARNGAELWATKTLDPMLTDPMEMATVELFQYMIGNTDFSVLGQHNIVLLRTTDGRVTPLPFDFDFSGLVYAKYAGPDPSLPLKSHRERLYRGICHPSLDWDELFPKFRDKRAEVFALLDATPGLSRRAQKSTREYLQKFYEVLDSPEQRQKKIVDACRMVVTEEVD